MRQEEFDEMSYQMFLASTILAFGDARNEDVFLLHCLQNKKWELVKRVNTLTIEQNRFLEELTKTTSMLTKIGNEI